jgi:quinol monooxygenase YgiN
MIHLLAHLKAPLDSHTELMTATEAMIAATRMEPSSILFDLNVSVTDLQSMVFVEARQSREALAEHFETPDIAAWRRASKCNFTERKIEIIQPEKGEVT